MPEAIVRGVTHHHLPESGIGVVCDVTFLANRVAHAIEEPIEIGEKLLAELDPGPVQRTGSGFVA